MKHASIKASESAAKTAEQAAGKVDRLALELHDVKEAVKELGMARVMKLSVRSLKNG